MRARQSIAGVVAISAALAGPGFAQDGWFDRVSGYRIAAYRGVVPGPPPGIARIDSRDVAALIDARRAILIDVTPAEGGVRDADGRWRLARPHDAIPGAAWFPEAGRGTPAAAIERWFLDGVTALRRNRPRAALIVFCLADCWMSWNAAQRLRRAGFADVRWYAEGNDGWIELGRPLTRAFPYGGSK